MKDLLQKTHLRALMLVALLCAGFNSAWGEDITVTLTQSSLGLTGSYTTDTEKTIDGITYVYTDLMKNNSNIQAKASSGTIYNKTPYPECIKSVAVTHSGTARATTILGSSDGTNWTQVSTGSGSITADFSGKGYNYFRITRGSNAAYWTKIEIIYGKISDDPSVATTTTINATGIKNTDVYTSTEAGQLTASVTADGSPVEGATITWSSSNTGVATIASDGTVTLVAAGATTITASYAGEEGEYKPSSAIYELTVIDSNAPGTENNPYTVAEALDNAPASGNSSVVYVKGIVSSFWESNTSVFGDTYHRYYISDNGTTENQLLVYNGKGLNNKDFNENSNNGVEIGDVVLITGQLTTYKGTKELAINNYIVSLTRTERADADLSFGENTSFEINFGDTFTAPTLSNPHGLAVSYSSSNEAVATVDATGKVTILSKGTVTITASSDVTNEYKAGEASYTIKVNRAAVANEIFYESFDMFSGTGGNDGKWNGSIASAKINENGNVTDNNGWTQESANAANQCVKFGSASAGGNIETPAIDDFDGGAATMTFLAGGWDKAGEGNTLKIQVDNGTVTPNEITVEAGEFKAFNIEIEGAATGSKIKFVVESKNNRVFIDEISIVKKGEKPAAPIIFHDGGEYEGALKVAMTGQGTIKYTLNGGAEQTYSAPINVSETTTITAWTESNGMKSDEVSKTFTIAAATAGPAVEDNYYTIKNNGNNKYVNVAGRKTVTFVDETATAAGTVIRVKANDKGQVQILRSQGVDIPGYAEKAMNYVPKIVELIVDKLHAEGSGELLGENGLDAIMAKFKESFDYHLYLEEANGGYRIYGRTPSMQPVVDFYAENKANVDAKLPGLEAFINSAIEKVLQKTNGSGASILVPFSLQTVWEKMGSTLTEPVDEASTAKFYEEVLSSEANVWNFAYETAMIYWTKLKEHPKFQDNLDKLGDYAKYIDKVENIRPNFKYYIVQKDNQLDFISQGNSELNAAFTTWTLAERTDFSVAFPEENVKNAGKEHYTTLYTDFAYTLPEGVKAYKVTAINETTGVATTEEISGTIPAQTPVLLSATNEELTQTLTLNVNDAGSAPTDNLLVGPDYLINTYNIKTEQVEGLFNMSKELLGENAYSTYLAEYEHLMLKNSGTVNNKYFFGLDEADLELCTYKNEDDVDDCVVRSLSTGDEKLGFYNNWEVKANQAFLVSDKFNPVKLTLKGDVTRDGLVNVNDVTATVDITLNKATLETHSDIYDFDAADADDSGAINVTDVIIIVNLSLGKE